MRQLGSQARALFDRLFPERQIMQRSCGAVRGMRLSPGRQALIALAGVGVAGWCVYATATTMFEGPQPAAVVGFQSERAKYERWLDDVRGRAVAAQEMLEQSTRRFERATHELETRHEILRAMLEYAHGSRLRLGSGEQHYAFLAVDGSAPPSQRAAGLEPQRAEPVSLRGRDGNPRARFGDLLGPRQAAADEFEAAATVPAGQFDFAASVRDPGAAERVAVVAARIAALRRMTAYR